MDLKKFIGCVWGFVQPLFGLFGQMLSSSLGLFNAYMAHIWFD